jgi:hypothetical protein
MQTTMFDCSIKVLYLMHDDDQNISVSFPQIHLDYNAQKAFMHGRTWHTHYVNNAFI